MKDKIRKDVVATAPETSVTPSLSVVPTIAESLTETDRGLIENAKLKRELAMSNVKGALAQSENAELSYNNIILQLALKYKLSEGDIIEENGNIKRVGS